MKFLSFMLVGLEISLSMTSFCLHIIFFIFYFYFLNELVLLLFTFIPSLVVELLENFGLLLSLLLYGTYLEFRVFVLSCSLEFSFRECSFPLVSVTLFPGGLSSTQP